MKLIVHVTRNDLNAEDAEELFEEIKQCLAEKWPTDPNGGPDVPYLHVNGQIVNKFTGSHNQYSHD